MSGLASLLLALSVGFHSAFFQTDIFIEEIRLKDETRVSLEIVLSESRLNPGRIYTEQELLEAVQRLNRLTFIRYAEFSLEKGSERGKYVLVIELHESTPFFLSLHTQKNYQEGQTWEYEQTHIGYRHFLGKSGMVYLALDPGDVVFDQQAKPTGYTFGYSRFNLFNRNLFAGAQLTLFEDYVSEQEAFRGTFYRKLRENYQFDLNLSVPVGRDQWLKFDYSRQQADYSSVIISDSGEEINPYRDFSRSWIFNLSWEHNTTNDNVVPTRGNLTNVTGTFIRQRNQPKQDDQIPRSFFRQDELSLVFDHVRYKSVFKDHAFRWGIHEAYWKSKVTVPQVFRRRTWRNQLMVGFSADLWGYNRTARWGDLRLDFEGLATADLEYYDEPRPESGNPITDEFVEFRLSLIYRGAWGLLRFTLRYLD